jgi:hypothetical protein
MMTGEQCRAKAKAAFDTARAATNPILVAEFEAHAREWLLLAVTADAQAQLERELIGRIEG